MSNVETVTAVIEGQLAKINGGRVSLALHGTNPVAVYADVKNGRGPRGVNGEITAKLPIIGSREVSRFGDELDQQRAGLVVVFTISGIINGVPYEDVTIWINAEQVTLPTLFGGTDRARQTLYTLGRAVRDEVAAMPGLMSQAWEDHVNDTLRRVAELRAYLDDVTAAGKRQINGAKVTIGTTARRSR